MALAHSLKQASFGKVTARFGTASRSSSAAPCTSSMITISTPRKSACAGACPRGTLEAGDDAALGARHRRGPQGRHGQARAVGRQPLSRRAGPLVGHENSVPRVCAVFLGLGQHLVGEAGFEPATTSTQSLCTTGLCDSPNAAGLPRLRRGRIPPRAAGPAGRVHAGFSGSHALCPAVLFSPPMSHNAYL